MHRFLFISLALVCLLAGCSAPQTSDPATDESDSLDAYFEEEPADNEMGSAEFGLQDPMDTVYTYDGESLEIPFSITGASFGKTTEIGVLLFVDGVASPIPQSMRMVQSLRKAICRSLTWTMNSRRISTWYSSP